MDSLQSSKSPSEGSLRSLLCKTRQDDDSSDETDLPSFNEEELKHLHVGDEVTITTETSIAAVISSSLQTVNDSKDLVHTEELDGHHLCEDSYGVPGDAGEADDGFGTGDACEAGEPGEGCDPGDGPIKPEEDSSKLSASPQNQLSLAAESLESLAGQATRSADDCGVAQTACSEDADQWHDLVHKTQVNEDTNSLQHESPLLSTFQPPFVPPPPTSSQAHTLTPLPPLTNTNNSNSCDPTVNSPSVVSPVIVAIGEPPRKRAKMTKHGQIEVTLEGKNLWDEFYRRGTEMIVNRLGRRMFPGFAVGVNGLKPKTKYSMKVEMILADNHRFKFLNGRWLAVGNAEPQPLSETYIHPDSPNTGAFWMRHGVSFRKLKVTNNKERPGNNALIHSMHKYYLRLIIDEEFKSPPTQKIPAKNVLRMDFPETSFIAVTAYQNEEVTQLKITNNPFAKAFRENAAEMDWEMLYHHNGMYSPSIPTHPDVYGNHHLMQPGMWPPQSSMLPPTPLPPTPLSSTLPPYSPLTGVSPNQGGTSFHTHEQYQYQPGMTPAAFPGSTGSVPGAGSYFQWPQIGGHRNTNTGSGGSQPLSSMVTPQSSVPSGALTHQDSYEQYHPPHRYTAATIHPPTTHHINSTLPDFDSAFTASVGHS